jgi:hypothetical protein
VFAKCLFGNFLSDVTVGCMAYGVNICSFSTGSKLPTDVSLHHLTLFGTNINLTEVSPRMTAVTVSEHIYKRMHAKLLYIFPCQDFEFEKL